MKGKLQNRVKFSHFVRSCRKLVRDLRAFDWNQLLEELRAFQNSERFLLRSRLKLVSPGRILWMACARWDASEARHVLRWSCMCRCDAFGDRCLDMRVWSRIVDRTACTDYEKFRGSIHGTGAYTLMAQYCLLRMNSRRSSSPTMYPILPP